MAIEHDLGSVIGPQGPNGLQGISVTNSAINSAGRLIITLSNGTNIDAGNAKGNNGATGAKGTTGAQGVAGKSAYQQAKEGGYTKTEAQFIIELNSISSKANSSDVYTKEQVMSLMGDKAPLNNPRLTGTVTLNGKDIPTTENGAFAKLKLSNKTGHEAVLESYKADYTKVGRLVFVRISFKLESKGTLVDSDSLYIEGLPFISSDYNSLSASWWNGAALPNGFGGEASGVNINLYKPASTGATNVKASDITAAFTMEDLSGCYITNY